jgi:hypothetical protein
MKQKAKRSERSPKTRGSLVSLLTAGEGGEKAKQESQMSKGFSLSQSSGEGRQ